MRGGALAILALAGLVPALACGGAGGGAAASAGGPPPLEGWPAPSETPADAISVKQLLAGKDGDHVRVRAYLVAAAPPCPPCVAPPPPATCSPCPPLAATFGDDDPTAGLTPTGPTLRAVGLAGNLASRHVGGYFLLSGTLRVPKGAAAELSVYDVRALIP